MRFGRLTVSIAMAVLVQECGGNGKNSKFDFPSTAELLASTLPGSLKTAEASTSQFLLASKRAQVVKSQAVDQTPFNQPRPDAYGLSYLIARFWDMDYGHVCTDTEERAGRCWKCYTGENHAWFVRPPALSDPEICRRPGDSMDQGTSVLSTACTYDRILVDRAGESGPCTENTGADVDLSVYFPWRTSWSLPASVKVQGAWFSKKGVDFGTWYKLGAVGEDQSLVLASLGGGQMDFSFKDPANNTFTYIQVQSIPQPGGDPMPARLRAYLGELPDPATGSESKSFEVIQQDKSGTWESSSAMLIRMKSNGSHIWSQYIAVKEIYNGFKTQADIDALLTASEQPGSTPLMFSCIKLESNIAISHFVEQAECLASFRLSTGNANLTEADLYKDSFFKLKLLPFEAFANQEPRYSAVQTPLNETNEGCIGVGPESPPAI